MLMFLAALLAAGRFGKLGLASPACLQSHACLTSDERCAAGAISVIH